MMSFVSCVWGRDRAAGKTTHGIEMELARMPSNGLQKRVDTAVSSIISEISSRKDLVAVLPPFPTFITRLIFQYIPSCDPNIFPLLSEDEQSWIKTAEQVRGPEILLQQENFAQNARLRQIAAETESLSVQSLPPECVLSYYRNLKYFKTYAIDDTGLKTLRKFTSLQEIDLSFCHKVTDAGLQHLATLVNLRKLNLSNCRKITIAGLQHLQGLTKLQHVNLFGTELNIKDPAILKRLFTSKDLKNPLLQRAIANIESLELHYEDSDAWCSLSQYPNLKRIRLLNMTDAGFQRLAGLGRLQELTLYFCDGLTGEGFQDLIGLTNLRKLSLEFCRGMTDAGFAQLAKLDTVQQLTLKCCSCVTDAGLAHIATMSALQQLAVRSSHQMTDAGLKIISTLANLQILDLSFCRKITDAGFRYLASCKNLQELVLKGCTQLTGTGLEYLIWLEYFRELDLMRCYGITDAGFRYLPEFEDLKRLNLSCVRVTDERLQIIAAIHTLQELDLSDCTGFTRTGLSFLKKMQTLREFRCPVSVMKNDRDCLNSISSLIER